MTGRTTPLRVPAAVLRETFAEHRRCGEGVRECQVLWVGPWADPDLVSAVEHPAHRPVDDGFELESGWLTDFWRRLVATGQGIRVQVHTHPGRAFHSPTDDAWPIIRSPGFLSLVIPRFARGAMNFRGTWLAELMADGSWRRVRTTERFRIV